MNSEEHDNASADEASKQATPAEPTAMGDEDLDKTAMGDEDLDKVAGGAGTVIRGPARVIVPPPPTGGIRNYQWF
jgi:hypothetical protein